MSRYSVTDIEVRNDGVYVLINTESKNVKSDILSAIQRYQVEDVDYIAIDEAIKENKDEQLISENKNLYSRNEDIEIQIAEDKMSASIIFEEPVNSENKLTKDDIVNRLNNKGIRYGIDEDLINNLIEEKDYNVPYLVVKGEKPVEGTDGYLQFLFETDKKSLKPVMREDGSVDYYNLNLFDSAVEGQKLVISHPAIKGKDGINIFGKNCQPQRIKPAPHLPKGKNTVISEDGTTLSAEISGRIFYMDGRVSILPVLEISSNVDASTGNIEFIGSIIIKGSITSGFSVIAGGDVEAEGSVEGATIKAKGNILLMKGVQGGNKAVIEAGGDINANFIESSEITAGGNITAKSIMHSLVRCGGTLELIGKRGLFVGGKAVVGSKIIARVIGSSMSTLTELEVGVDPNKLEQYKQAVKDIEQYTEDFKKTEKIIEILSKNNISDLSNDKKKMLMDSIRSKIVIKSKINAAHTKIETIMPTLHKKNGKVEVSDIIYAGVKVTINNAVMYVRDDLVHCSLYNNSGKVYIGALV